MKVNRGRRRVVTGLVLSDRMDKTVAVQVERLVRHPDYNKLVRRRVKVKAHDEENQCRAGDKVRIMETRPLSRDKCWRVVEVIEKAL